ncbi:MAG TPA: hypothetical protein PLK35_03410 [Candidatus Moranbacteria bacterium]|nr:hypothetical protein [Candidatus Moranbacteria bacterium]
MPLSDIKNKLYKKEEEKDLSAHGQSEFNPRIGNLPEKSPVDPGDAWQKEKKGLDEGQKKTIKKGLIVLGCVIGAILILVAAYFIRKSSFDSERVTVEISGPTQAESGKLLTYEIKYKNNNRKDLSNVNLKIIYPEDFKPEDNANFVGDGPVSGNIAIGEIKGHSEGKIIFNGRMYSPKGALIYLKGELSYNPGSFSTKYVSQGQLGINVSTSPLTLEILAPQFVANGDEVNYLVTYKNNGENNMDSLRIRMDYPEGFTFSNSDPKVFEGNNVWYIGQLTPGQRGQVVVSGKLEGEKDQIKKVKVYIGSTEKGNFVSYSESDAETKMAASPLTISQTVNNVASLNVNAGEMLRFKINYRNDGNIGLTNAIVTEKIDSPVLDYTTLETNGGYYDASNKTITWKASDHSDLKNLVPGQSGSIEFLIKVKEVIPVSSANDKNFVISSIAKIDSPDVPTIVQSNKIIAGNKMDMKLNSKLVVDVKGFFTDPNITNSGPIPPKVNNETTYTLHWLLTNVSNDVTGAKVEAVLPTGVVMTGKIWPEDSKITYNERTNSITWEVGNISSGIGILSSAKEASFQVKIKPSANQAGNIVGLLNESKITAKDSFTGEDLSGKGDEKSTQLREDSGIGSNYKVVN